MVNPEGSEISPDALIFKLKSYEKLVSGKIQLNGTSARVNPGHIKKHEKYKYKGRINKQRQG